MIITVSS